MAVYRDREAGPKGGVLTMGVFDGIHAGHKYLLNRCVSLASELQTFVEVWIFHPHPRSVLRDIQVPALTTIEERIALLHEAGVGSVRLISFTKAFSTLSAEEFIVEWIQTLSAPRAVVIGYDHRFGRDREGSAELLKAVGLHAEEISAYERDSGPVSSSQVRQLLMNGQIRSANELLGYPFTIRGVVRPGRGEARQLGVPTANIPYPESKVRVASGIYVGRVEMDFTDALPVRGGMPALLYVPPTGDAEVHILREKQSDLYGRRLSVGFFEYLRPHQVFSTSEELREAILSDVQRAHEYFRGVWEK
ncbi:MAG: riboflavin biosynthesis protein RibF [Bacteroidia bacterium]|nr:riboflavin biosynthesis protein RibF [Bacteroidia bacterium]MCX7652872.1 riboflavin biosynthesis protein RibF [Bacteroidia bacterium]MDW8416660.1 riboflavin biosynthesis protein RibF [Bacteroidia bacterium]